MRSCRSIADHGWNSAEVVNPQDPAAFTNAKLCWPERDQPGHAEILALYSHLLRLRCQHPDLADPRLDRVGVDFDEEAQWVIVHRGAFDVSGQVIVGTWPGQEPGQAAAGLQMTLPAQSACIIRGG